MVEVKNDKVTHNVVLENRNKLSVTSVSDVSNYDEKQISAFTEMGFLTIKGSNLRIKNFNTDSGELGILGKINELAYSKNKKRSAASFFSRLFK